MICMHPTYQHPPSPIAAVKSHTQTPPCNTASHRRWATTTSETLAQQQGGSATQNSSGTLIFHHPPNHSLEPCNSVSVLVSYQDDHHMNDTWLTPCIPPQRHISSRLPYSSRRRVVQSKKEGERAGRRAGLGGRQPKKRNQEKKESQLVPSPRLS